MKFLKIVTNLCIYLQLSLFDFQVNLFGPAFDSGQPKASAENLQSIPEANDIAKTTSRIGLIRAMFRLPASAGKTDLFFCCEHQFGIQNGSPISLEDQKIFVIRISSANILFLISLMPYTEYARSTSTQAHCRPSETGLDFKRERLFRDYGASPPKSNLRRVIF